MQHQRQIGTRARINSTEKTLARPPEAVCGTDRAFEGKASVRTWPDWCPPSCCGDVAAHRAARRS